MADLVVKVSGDVNGVKGSLKEVGDSAKDLESELATVARVSAVAFAALTAEVFLSVKAYAAQEQATNRLTQALANQGIYSKQLFDDYRLQADALQTLTGIDDDAIVSGQALLQGYLGQTRITKELTNAVIDLSVAKGIELNAAFDMVGKSIGTNTNALARHGIEVNANATAQEKLRTVIDGINGQFKGQAEASAQGLGSLKLLQNTFGDLQEAIGERFAPVIKAGTKALTDLLNGIKNNPALVDLIASVTTAGVVVGGLGLVVGTAGIGFLKLKAALDAAKISTSAMSISVKGLIGATGLGLLLIMATEVYLNWSAIWPRMQAAFEAFVGNVGALGAGLGQILKGIFTLDRAMISAGMETAKQAFLNGYQEYQELVTEADRAAHQKKLEEEAQRATELNDQQRIFKTQAQTEEEQFQAKLAELRKQAADKKIGDKAKEHFTYLENERKFGKSYADIHRFLNREEITEGQQHFSKMSQMQQSQNSTLKAMGKAAAVASITIDTARSAMAIFKWFSETIPIIGPALGAAGAAGAVAFGAEQIGKVTAAAQGGLITGGIAGVDSVPLLAQQGELVAPVQNFEEVIGSVRAQREAQRIMESGQSPGFASPSAGAVEVMLTLKDDLMDFIEAKIVERQNLNISLQGA